MRQMPANKLDPRVKNVWRVNDGIWIVLVFVFLAIFPTTLAVLGVRGTVATFAVWGILFAATAVVFLVILPPIRYMRWRYEVTEDYLDIAKGIIWRKRYIIPFIRVQNTDTRQGPIMRAFKLASVTVSTAAREHEIPGLDLETAEMLRDRAAELARLAREDV